MTPPGSPELWRPIDRRLLGTGLWPHFPDISEGGPGGGADRVDPGAGVEELTSVNLNRVVVKGLDQLRAGNAGAFIATGVWSDGVELDLEPQWEVSAPATISPSGILDTHAIAVSGTVVVRAIYSSGGFDLIGEKQVNVAVPVFRVGSVQWVAGKLNLDLTGASSWRVRMERSTDLRIWTEAGDYTLPPSGLQNLSVAPIAGRSAEFLRARLLP